MIDFQWPPLRFGWKRRMATGLPSVAAIEEAPDADDKESNSKSVAEDKAPPKAGTAAAAATAATATAGKSSKKEAKEGRKSGTTTEGSSLMDIGVWNPDAVKSNPNPGTNFISISGTYLYETLMI